MSRFILYRDAGHSASVTGHNAGYAGSEPGLDAGSGASAMRRDNIPGDLSVLRDSGSETVRYGDYVLTHYGNGYRREGDTGIFIGGYIIPRNDVFRQYGGMGQHALVSHLYSIYGSSFTDYVKGIFVVIILKAGGVELFFDRTGLYRAFYCTMGGRFMIANTVSLLAGAGAELVPDKASLSMQALFHRVPGRYTVYRDIFKTTGADHFSLGGSTVRHTHYFEPGNLMAQSQSVKDVPTEEFARVFRENVINLNSYLKPESTFITLTGGKDSRTILAALLGAGIKPEGLTYGNSLSRDAVYASILARAAGISHTVTAPPDEREWFEMVAGKILGEGDPEISIHRSHRLYAFTLASERSSAESAYYAGYMGGELLMGIYYDDLIFTGFLRKLWSGSPSETLISERLREYFIIPEPGHLAEVRERVKELSCTDMSLPRPMREFHALFEIGVPHHSQDITLASGFWNYPAPAFLDTDFLELLFRSRDSFLFRDATAVNPFRRHELFRTNMGIQHILYPELDTVPFGKRGSYNTSEYLRGPLLWSLVKGFRYLTDRKKYPPSFSYGREYAGFLAGMLDEAKRVRSTAGRYYDLERASVNLGELEFPLQEKDLHKYSAIATFHMLYRDKG